MRQPNQWSRLGHRQGLRTTGCSPACGRPSLTAPVVCPDLADDFTLVVLDLLDHADVVTDEDVLAAAATESLVLSNHDVALSLGLVDRRALHHLGVLVPAVVALTLLQIGHRAVLVLR